MSNLILPAWRFLDFFGEGGSELFARVLIAGVACCSFHVLDVCFVDVGFLVAQVRREGSTCFGLVDEDESEEPENVLCGPCRKYCVRGASSSNKAGLPLF